MAPSSAYSIFMQTPLLSNVEIFTMARLLPVAFNCSKVVIPIEVNFLDKVLPILGRLVSSRNSFEWVIV